MRLRKITAGLLALAFVGCADQTSNIKSDGIFVPAPKNKTSIESKLSRFEGQTEFLNPVPYRSNRFDVEEAIPQASNRKTVSGGAKRDLQESDIFKVGAKGSKLLYLLNNYRGLQVVSFEDGAKAPKITGRVLPTGNRPQIMYSSPADNDQLVVVENHYDDNKSQGRILVYDVSDASDPVELNASDFQGRVVDSRLVGDILYIASYQYNYVNNFSGTWQERLNQNKGYVTSFKVTDEGVEKIQEQQLALPAYRENMNIVEVEDQGSYKYYLVSSGSVSGWGWWRNRASAVEVLDISDADGKVSPVMIAPVKGTIRERSSTLIRNNTLVAVSNYRAASGLSRVAVETFAFPTKKSTILDQAELEYRKAHIERELRLSGVTDPSDLADLREKLNNDKELGLNARYVVGKTGNVEKLSADSFTSVGSSNGQSASLQDVRVDGNLLYAFWVPANNIDPLDVFDISNPENGVAHKAHLEFEGWIQRAIPMTYKGKKYILGLGRITPTVDNEFNFQKPQARLFEIKEYKNGKMKAIDVADMVFEDKNVWTNFNNQDKFVEVKFTGEGEGQLLFQISTRDSNGRYVSGGKVVKFDLGAIDDGEAFVEGSTMAAKWGYLRRVFTNSEIDKINTFTDQELSVFNTSGNNDKSFKDAVATLELARNVVAFERVSANKGIQFITRGNNYNYRYSSASNARTILRSVLMSKVDAEQNEVKSELALKGTYKSHKVVGKKLLLLTQNTRYEKIKNPTKGRWPYQRKTVFFAYTIDLKGKLKVTESVDLTKNNSNFYWGGSELVAVSDSDFLYQQGQDFLKFSMGKNLTVTQINGIDCKVKSTYPQLRSVDGQLVMTFRKNYNAKGELIDPQSKDKNLDRNAINYASMIKLVDFDNQTDKFSCSAEINIPGDLTGINKGHLITNDLQLVDTVEEERKHWKTKKKIVHVRVVTQNVMDSLSLKGNIATLADMYQLNNQGYYSNNNLVKLNDGSYLTLKNPAAIQNNWGGGIIPHRGFGRPWRPSPVRQDVLMSKLSFDANKRFLKETKVVPMALGNSSSIAQVTEFGGKAGTVVFISNGQKMHAVDFYDFSAGLSQVKFKAEEGIAGKDELDALPLGGYYWSRNKYLVEDDQVIIPRGLAGVLRAEMLR